MRRLMSACPAWALVASLSIVPMIAMAQTPASAAPAQQASAPVQDLEPNQAVNAAGQVLQMVDSGKLDAMWEGASPTAKKLVSKDRFIADVTAARQSRGQVASRHWTGVTRRISAGSATLPAGNYLSVEFETRFANGSTATELVSFRLDPDVVWRATGYVVK